MVSTPSTTMDNLHYFPFEVERATRSAIPGWIGFWITRPWRVILGVPAKSASGLGMSCVRFGLRTVIFVVSSTSGSGRGTIECSCWMQSGQDV